MPARAGIAYVDILPRFDKFVAGVQAGMNRVGKQLDTIGTRLTKTLALPLALAGGAAVKLAADFEQSMSRIEGLVGLSAREVSRLGNEVLNLAPKVGKGPRELADALYFVVSSGIDAADAMEVVRQAARAASAGLGDTRTVADALTSAMNAYKTSGLTAAQATDILTATVREGKGEASELAGAIGRVIPIAANAGVSFDQVGAAIASMTLTGLDANEAVTALRQFLVLLLKPAQQSRKALSDLGLTQADVAQLTQRLNLSLAKGGFSIERLRQIVSEKGLFEGMVALKTALGDNKDALGNVIPNVRALAGFLSITGESAAQNQKIFEELAVAAGSTDAAFDAAAKTARFKMQAALAGLQSAGIRLGGVLLPVVKDIVDGIANLADRFSRLSPATKDVIAKALLFFVVLGPLVKIMAMLTRTVSGLIGIFKVVRTVIFNLRIAFFLLRAAVLANPFALLVAALVAVGVVIFKFRKQIWEAIQVVGEFFARIGRDFVNGLRVIGDFFSNAAQAVGRFFTQTLPRALLGALKAIANFFLALPGRILGFVNEGLQSLIAGLVVFAYLAVTGLVKGFIKYLELLVTFWRNLPGVILKVLIAAGEFLFNVGQAIIKGLLNGIVAYFKFVIDFYRKLPGRIIALFAAAGSWLFKAGVAILTGLYNGIKQIWNTVIGFFKSIPGAIVRAIGDLSKLLFNIGKSILTGLIDGAKKALSGVKDFFGGIGKKITQWKGPLSDDKVLLVPAGKVIMKGLVAGVEAEEDALQKALQRVTGNVQGLLGGFGSDMRFQAHMTGVAGSVRSAAGDTHITNNITVNNPKPERLELSLPAALRRAELARARG